jgi:hypothetical protein
VEARLPRGLRRNRISDSSRKVVDRSQSIASQGTHVSARDLAGTRLLANLETPERDVEPAPRGARRLTGRRRTASGSTESPRKEWLVRATWAVGTRKAVAVTGTGRVPGSVPDDGTHSRR